MVMFHIHYESNAPYSVCSPSTNSVIHCAMALGSDQRLFFFGIRLEFSYNPISSIMILFS